MDKGINQAITEYIRLIRKSYSGIEKAYLFGSHAKGHPGQHSDIDLALIFKTLDESERFDTQVKLMLLASQIDSRIEPHPISHNDFYSGSPFGVEILKTGIEIT